MVEDAGGATSNRFGYRNNGTYRIQDADSGSVDIGAYAATAQVATWNYEGGVLSLYVDSVLQSPTPAFDMTAAVWAGVVVGGQSDGNTSFERTMELGEMIFVPRALTASEIGALRDYLSARWA